MSSFVKNWFYFLLHRYSAQEFDVRFVKESVKVIASLQITDKIACNRVGRLFILKTKWQKFLFWIKDISLFGALSSRVQWSLFYTFSTLLLEYNNPLSPHRLKEVIDRKAALTATLLNRLGARVRMRQEIEESLNYFLRNSYLQLRVITKMHQAVHRQKKSAIIDACHEGLAKGVVPILNMRGFSGSYWMRGADREILALFKPFDEELKGPNCPAGQKFCGLLGQRPVRSGVRVGQGPLHEVAAYCVDEFLGLSIVPKTYFASFSHSTFFSAHEQLGAGKRGVKTKLGSLQEFVGGFVGANHAHVEQIPLDEFQRLVLFDVLVGNLDRNPGNLLICDQKIAAIDHGLIFPDLPCKFEYWFWEVFPQAKEPLSEEILYLINNFPFEALANRLHKRCLIGHRALTLMQERLASLVSASAQGVVPADYRAFKF